MLRFIHRNKLNFKCKCKVFLILMGGYYCLNINVLLCNILGGNYLVNFEMEIKKINPINIKEMELNRYKINNDIKKSIILYNSAIGEIKKATLSWL